MKTDKALWIFDWQVKERGKIDWLKAHTGFLRPLHRYEGEIRLKEGWIELLGKEVQTDRDYYLKIQKEDLVGTDLGYDDIFRRREDRSLGIGLTPLKIEYREREKDRRLYLFVKFRRLTRTSKNREWFKELMNWMTS